MGATLLYSSLTGLLIFALSANVTRLRARYDVAHGHGDNDEIRNAIRAHGNLIEYAPIVLFLLFLVEASGQGDRTFLHVVGGSFVLGRVLHAAGMLYNKDIGRIPGSLITLLTLGGLSVYGLMVALG